MTYSLFRIFSYAIKNFVRNIGLSMMTITILVLALLSINTLIIVNNLTNASIDSLQSRVDVSIDFYPDADQVLVEEIYTTIQDLPEVESSVFLTPDEVRERFIQRFSEDESIISGLDVLDSNPFGASLLIKAQSPEDYESILEYIRTPAYGEIIEEKSFGEHAEVLSKIGEMTQAVRTTAIIFASVFGLFSIFIIFNSIRIALYTQREEIGIMRLVGASKWFIRGPFYFEALLFVIIAIAVSMSLTFLVLDVVDPSIKQAFVSTGYSLIVDMRQQLIGIILLQFTSVLFMTWVAASVAMHKHLQI